MATNIAVLEGIVGKDAVVKTFGGDSVCNFSISISNGKNKDGSWKDSLWVEVAYWSKYAQETADKIKKGARVTVTGRLGLRTWEKDGKKGKELELKASDVSVPGGGASRDESGGGFKQGRSAGDRGDPPGDGGGFGDDDGIPF